MGSLSVNLTDRLERLVREKVDSGLYNSASEVVREALRLMERSETTRSDPLEQLPTRARQLPLPAAVRAAAEIHALQGDIAAGFPNRTTHA